MNRRGFSLVEVLVTIVIIALLSGIGIVSYRSLFGLGEENYYESVENDVLLASNDYFTDHREQLPVEGQYGKISLAELVEKKYLEPVKDSKGNVCNDGDVYVYRENNKYAYEVCLRCGGRTSSGKYCSGELEKTIAVTAITKDTRASYDITQSYNSTAYTNNENVLVTFNMASMDVEVGKYEIISNATNNSTWCNHLTGNACEKEFDTSGTYQIKAYDKNEKVISSRYINVKILRTGPEFTIEGNTKFIISKEECNGNKKAMVNFKIKKANINEEYKSIEYKIIPYGVTSNSVTAESINSLSISKELESGSYTLEVTISNFANNRGTNSIQKTTKILAFDISYFADIVFEDNKYDGLDNTHEVVKGQPYNYLKTLPTTKNNLEIRWLRNNESGITNLENRWINGTDRMTGDTIVTNSCTHTIVGMIRTTVPLINFATKCKTLEYNGSKQTLTNQAPSNVTFVNNEQTNAGTHEVIARIDHSKYIWSDDTFEDKKFNCDINKYNIGLTLNQNTGTINATEETTFTATPTVIEACKGKLTATSEDTNKVSILSGSSTTNATSAVTVKWKAVSYTTDTKIKVNYATSDTNNCNNPSEVQYTAKVNRKSQTITLAAITKTYNGNNQSASGATTSGDGTISYTYYNGESCSGTARTNAPIDAGIYSVNVKASQTSQYDEESICVKYTMNKASVSCTTSKGNYTYAGTIGSPSVSSNPGGGTVTYYRNTSNSTSGGTVWSGTTSTTLNVGTYYIYATIAATTNYNSATCSAGSFVISKASVSCTTSKAGYTYAGTRGNPSVSSNPGSGTVTYYYRTSSGTSGGAKYSDVTSTSLNVGTYYMYATIDETTNYKSATCSAGSFVISKASVSCTTIKDNYTYAGTRGDPRVSSNPGSGTVTYYYNTTDGTSGGAKYSDVTSTSLNAGTYYMYATIAATTNYNSATCSAGSFVISKAQLTCPKMAESTITYDAISHSYSGSSCPTGSSGTNAVGTNVGTYYGYCNADNNHYFSSTCTRAKLTISKAASTITCKATYNTNPVSYKLTFNGTAQSLVESSSGCKSISPATRTNATTNGVTVTCTGDDNHTDSSCTAYIGRANCSCSVRAGEPTTFNLAKGENKTIHVTCSGVDNWANGGATWWAATPNTNYVTLKPTSNYNIASEANTSPGYYLNLADTYSKNNEVAFVIKGAGDSPRSCYTKVTIARKTSSNHNRCTLTLRVCRGSSCSGDCNDVSMDKYG